ncbi:MAG TPA: hypothetical protein VFR97_00805 [Capillimicrobium sp.]|nr:hypothetical protein [Capillimicrobium sp.]
MSPVLPMTQERPAARTGGSSPLAPGLLRHPVFMPQPNEPIHAYVARLRAMHHHLTMLIEAVERGMTARPQRPAAPVSPGGPVLAPVPAARAIPEGEAERRGDAPDRRLGVRDRRQGLPDRRRGLADLRAVKVERRAGPRDRRSGRRDRRLGHDRRADARRTATLATPPVDPVAVFWGVNIACWLGITTVAMIWGVG